MPVPVEYCTVIGLPLAGETLTTKFASTVPEFPSVTVTSPMEIGGGPSSFVIVPVPAPSPTTAPAGFERVTLNDLSSSKDESFGMLTTNCLLPPAGISVSRSVLCT